MRERKVSEDRGAAANRMAPLVDAKIATALDDLTSRLGRLGCRASRSSPTRSATTVRHYALYLTLLAAVTSARIPAEQRRPRLAVLRTRDDESSRALQRGVESGAPDYVAWHAQREQCRGAWRAFLREWDVLLTPAFFVPAHPDWDKPWPDTSATLWSG